MCMYFHVVDPFVRSTLRNTETWKKTTSSMNRKRSLDRRKSIKKDQEQAEAMIERKESSCGPCQWLDGDGVWHDESRSPCPEPEPEDMEVDEWEENGKDEEDEEWAEGPAVEDKAGSWEAAGEDEADEEAPPEEVWEEEAWEDEAWEEEAWEEEAWEEEAWEEEAWEEEACQDRAEHEEASEKGAWQEKAWGEEQEEAWQEEAWHHEVWQEEAWQEDATAEQPTGSSMLTWPKTGGVVTQEYPDAGEKARLDLFWKRYVVPKEHACALCWYQRLRFVYMPHLLDYS